MTTSKFLLAALLAVGTFAVLPDTAEASPGDQNTSHFRGQRSHFRGGQYRPGHRARNNGVPELSIGAAAAALGLLGGGVMVLTGRRRVQKRD